MPEPTTPATFETTCTVGARSQGYGVSWTDTTTQCFRWANGLSPYDTIPLPIPPDDCYTSAHPAAPYSHWCPNLTDFGGSTGEVIWYDDTNAVDPTAGTFPVAICGTAPVFACVPGGLSQPKHGVWTCPCAHCSGIGDFYDPATHSCGPCNPDTQCWCDLSLSCVPCSFPPCFAELHCDWNSETCAWDCDPPACAPGNHWSWTDCECVGDCPDGQQWCDSTDSCITADKPPCGDELGCKWSSKSCSWVDCKDPATICGPGRTWDPDACNCGGVNGPRLLYDRWGHLHRAYAEPGDGIHYQRSDGDTLPWVLDGTVLLPGDLEPCVARDWDHRLRMVFVRGGAVQLSVCDDDGVSWSDPVDLFPSGYAHPIIRFDRSAGLLVSAAYNGGALQIRSRASGDAGWATAVTLTDETGSPLSADDDSFDLWPAPEGERRWLLTVRQGGAVTLWVSTDETDWTFKAAS